MKAFTIFNRKGGSGKTALSILSTAYLVASGRKVLAVDLDPQASMTEYFARIYEIEPAGPGAYEIVSGNARDDAPVTGITEKLSIVHADDRLSGIEASAMIPSLSRFLKENGSDYDYVIIDTPGNWSNLVQVAFSASDEVVIPAIPNNDDLENAIWSKSKADGYDLPSKIIINQWKGTKFHESGLELYRKDFGKSLCKSMVPSSDYIPKYTDTGEKLSGAKGKVAVLDAIGAVVREVFDKKAKAVEI